MANYNLYDDIDTGAISSAITSLNTKLQKVSTNVTTTQSAFTDSVWKATAKQTLFTAFNTINTEVIQDIKDYLSDLESIVGYIGDYRTARSNAKTASSNIVPNGKDNTYWNGVLSSAETAMDTAEKNINALKNG